MYKHKRFVMSVVKLVKWGNSLGIRIPAKDLKLINAYPGEEFMITTTSKGELTLTPIKQSEQAWLNAFNAAADAGDDVMLLKDAQNDFDKDEWTW